MLKVRIREIHTNQVMIFFCQKTNVLFCVCHLHGPKGCSHYFQEYMDSLVHKILKLKLLKHLFQVENYKTILYAYNYIILYIIYTSKEVKHKLIVRLSDIVHNSQKFRTIQISSNWWMNKQNKVCLYQCDTIQK